uniref:Uncharacterized protein n=1 Tax=viral metagenome TaxID=1070528 RepID=A0A6H1ZHM3_9ZZZZ
MKTLSEQNKDVYDAMAMMQKEDHCGCAGVACDKCGTEMVFSDMCVLTSYPPQRNVRCPKCGYTGRAVG